MKDNVENLIKAAKQATLTNEEKTSIRFALTQKMNNTAVPTPFWSFTFIRQYHYIPATLMILFVLGGGTSILAQRSLPGDALYPMKISVNENLESALTFNDKQSAEVEAIQATRRLEEAEILASEGVLTVKQNDEIKTSFSKKVNSLNEKLGKLSDKGQSKKAEEVLNNFDTNIKTKVNKLNNFSRKSTTSPASDIVTFIKRNHDENNSKKIETKTLMKIDSEEQKKLNDTAPQASLMSAEISTTSTTTATTTEDKLLNVRVIWSWKGEN
jgi:hypothetical protein